MDDHAELSASELRARLIWQRAPALTGALYLQLLEHAGSAQAALAAGPPLWSRMGLPPRCQAWLADPPSLSSAELAWLEHPAHHLIMAGDIDYPDLLLQLSDAPAGLFVRGNAHLLQSPQLAMVGSRNPTPYGREAAAAFAKQLSQLGLTITSGLAAGIDAAAHAGCLQGSGRTVAVCGTGLDQVYPRSSTALAMDLVAQGGALVSEFPFGTPVRKHHFPQRNRLISGLSLGTLVVEAALHSGSLITARLAAEQGREVFALPGSIHSPLSKGCHLLIRQGAKLVDSMDDMLSELTPLMGALFASNAARTRQNPEIKPVSENRLDKDSEILLDALGFEPAAIDQIVARSGLKADAVASLLLVLELDGRISTSPGGLYVRAGA